MPPPPEDGSGRSSASPGDLTILTLELRERLKDFDAYKRARQQEYQRQTQAILQIGRESRELFEAVRAWHQDTAGAARPAAAVPLLPAEALAALSPLEEQIVTALVTHFDNRPTSAKAVAVHLHEHRHDRVPVLMRNLCERRPPVLEHGKEGYRALEPWVRAVDPERAPLKH
jgi:hypothetical protein